MKNKRGPLVRPDCPKTNVLQKHSFLLALTCCVLEVTLPNIEENGQESVPAPLLSFQEFDDVLMPVLGSQVQGCFPIPISGLQIHAALGAKQLDGHQVARNAGQVKRRGAEVVRFLWVEAGVNQHLHQRRITLVRSPVQSAVTIHVCQMGLCSPTK